jgi:hypothetical protein
LCKTCADTRAHDECNHGRVDRSFWGVFTHMELNKALELDYIVLEIGEVYHYDKWAQYDGKDEAGLFSAYIDAFQVIKQQVTFSLVVFGVSVLTTICFT